jgi:DNA-binding LacI/PurR family transcriptional regulator
VANIMDVARLAGVSHQTVSRVLNNENTVRPQTRARVEEAIRELRNRLSSAARALVKRKTGTLGLVSTSNPLYVPASIALAFNGTARDAGYQAIMASMAAALLALFGSASMSIQRPWTPRTARAQPLERTTK